MIGTFARLTEDRLAEAAAMFCDVYAHEPWRYDWIDPAEITRYFHDLYATPGFRGFAALTGGRLAGFCAGLYSDYFSRPTYEIKEIAVARAIQRGGLGGRLLAYVEESMRAEGAAAVTLMTKETVGAFPFYTKHGYAPAESAVHMYKIVLAEP